MRAIVVGLGVQGNKRREYAGEDYVLSVDPNNSEADYNDIRDVNLDIYDAVLACVPDKTKIEILQYCVKHKKHVLVEKPLWVEKEYQIVELENRAVTNKVICYTAYNHRFEPHFMKMHDLIKSGELGEIYSCRMFYGNGTARLVRDSVWRDNGAGVLPDLGSHLLDTCRYWFDTDLSTFEITSAHRFENKAPDHVVINTVNQSLRIELEMTLCMWRNHFTCDILAKNGTAHIESLCKWGPSTFTHRKRILPSGRPTETQVTLVQPDPTWEAEYIHFKNLVESNAASNLTIDLSLQTQLRILGEKI